MAITRARTSSVAQGPSTRKTVLGGNDVILGGSYDAIGTVVVGSGGQSTITFSSIPSTYKHLQIRGMIGSTSSFGTLRFNGDTTTTNYRSHYLGGDGASPFAGTFANNAYYPVTAVTGAYSGILDVLDYQNTSKYKTVRTLEGTDNNGSGSVYLTSNLWMSTAAISSIVLTCNSGNFPQYSQFDLYGIK
jgi:hypothetical protein